ncbi:hypothetical protein ALC62_08250 [Cyphomyrmex costatus]|uniref:THAP-type domain-containing protein n=1 Tax=Cyphomyrmex costatus TaxID=456900 RepID=A0A195CLS7_9HYME|nr:hypothetical protein ALC62_08250 [Cyphomyrmex costatus]
MEGATFSPRSKVKHLEYCSVYDCRSNSNKNLTVRFHNFPKANKHVVYVKNIFGNLEKRDKVKAWMHALKIRNVTHKTRVCSLHFKREDYIFPGKSIYSVIKSKRLYDTLTSANVLHDR